VSFHFEETLVCTPAYEPGGVYEEDAAELVRVIADDGRRIALQHVLVVDAGSEDPMVVKHWRQVWTHEDPEQLVFRGHDTWETLRSTPEEAAGTWTQAVYQVGDAPRYESRGRWSHAGSSSIWDAEESWRPLPRREKHREDYQAVGARNRHVITPEGWAHEQQNRKLVLDGEGACVGVLVHELGLNRYERYEGRELAPAVAYWDGTAPFWADVRAVWSEALAGGEAWRIQGGRTINSLTSMADDYLEGAWRDEAERLDRIRDLVSSSLEPRDTTGSATPIEAAAGRR
jgi:hypothetical protein